jgi:hypothetical protein
LNDVDFDPPLRARTPKPGTASSNSMMSVFGGTGAIVRMLAVVSFTSVSKAPRWEDHGKTRRDFL